MVELDQPVFGAPTDPAYLEFLKGLKRVVALPVGKSLERWNAKDGHWWIYDPKTWGEEDVGAPPTPPGDALRQVYGGNFGEQHWELQELFLPALFTQLKTDYASLISRHPKANLVWTPDGAWRSAFKRPTDDDKKDHSGKELPPSAIDEIFKIRELERTGDLKHEEAEARIKKIKDQYGAK
jgi:hypothetical protein